MNTNFKIFGIFTAALNIPYIVWLFFNAKGALGLLLFGAEAMIGSLTFIFLFNHWTQSHQRRAHLPAKGTLDIFLPVVNEPLELFERTLKAVAHINYPRKTAYVLDDGHREEIKELAQKYKVVYLARKGISYYKAGNLNFGLENSSSEFILALDADQVAQPAIAEELLGYFSGDPKLAMIATRQSFNVPLKDFNHDILFYEHMQTGKNADNAAISCGSGVFYRRSALEKIGGFQTWNVVEDLYTSYVLHINGFKTLYINKAYTQGTAPLDLSTIYKQRGTWALDTLRLFFRHNPLFESNLTWRQRLHYFEIAWAYIVSALAIPVLFLLPPVTLFLDRHIIFNENVYLFLRVPSLAAILYFYYRLSGRMVSTSQFWASMSFVYLKALVLSLLPVRIKYKVTNKMAGIGKRDIALISPHLAFLIFGISAIVWRIFLVDFGITPFVAINALWVALMIYWFSPIIRKGFVLE